MSHADPKVLTEILQAMKCYFNKIAIRRGENHDLFGVKISMNRKEQTMSIDMKDQIEEAFDMFHETVNDTVTSYANNNSSNACNIK